MKKYLLISILGFQFISSAQDLNLGLVAYFPFNGNANDESATNIDGTVIDATLAVGLGNETNGCYSFNGTSAYIDCTNDNRNITDQVTISYWIKTDVEEHDVVVAKYNYTEGNGYAAYLQFGESALGGRDGSGPYMDSGYGTTYIPDGAWHHVVAVVDVNAWQIWIDCNMEASYTSSTPAASVDLQSSDHLTIGKWYFELPYYVEGFIDEVRIYNRALTPTEMGMLCDESQFLTTDEATIPANNVSLFPNPCSDLVTIESAGIKHLEIYNTLGQMVYQEDVLEGRTKIEINTSEFENGNYVVVITYVEAVKSEQLIIVH